MRVNKILLFAFIVSSFRLIAQNKQPLYIGLSKSEIQITEFRNGIVYRELMHADLPSYSGSEEFLLFGPDGEYIGNPQCVGPSCLKYTMDENKVELVSNEKISKDKLGYPIGISLSEDQLKIGEYKISVKNADGNILHVRTFRIVNPQPEISYLEIANELNGKYFNATDTLWVERNKSFSKMKIKLNGAYCNQEFESVSIQGMKLEMDKSDSLFYTFSNDWESNNALSLELGESAVIFDRKMASLPTSKSIFITAPNPKIMGEPLEFYVEEGQSQLLVNLHVENIYKNAKVFLAESRSSRGFIENSGMYIPTVNTQEGTITFPVIFNPIGISGKESFRVKVINADTKESEFRTITLIKKSTTIKMVPIDASKKPLVTGIDNYVKFERLDGPQLNNSKNNVYIIKFDNNDSIRLEAEMISNDFFTSTLPLPANLPSGTVTFTLRNGNKSWNGEVKGILQKPKIYRESDVVFRGGTAKVLLENATDVFLQLEIPNEFVSISQPENNATREFQISIDEQAEDFTVLVKLFDHIITKLSYKVENYPSPESISVQQIVDSKFLKKRTIVLDENSHLTLNIPVDGRYVTTTSKFTAQIYKKDGTPIGNKRKFIADSKGKKLRTTLNTNVGLHSGDEFDVLISNPNGDSQTYHSYIKRENTDKWIITAGLSAVDYRITGSFSEDENRASVLNGVNLGFYRMVENYSNPSMRLIGFGPNILLTGDQNDIKLRFAGSLLLLEKIVLGVSFGRDGMGMLAGVNIQLADLSILLSR